MSSLTCSAVSVILLGVVGAGCQPTAAAGTTTVRSAEPKNAKPLLPDDVERPFAPKTGVALVGSNGALVAVRLWESDAIACTSAVDSSRSGTVLSLTPNVEGARLDDRAAVLFDTRSQERRVVKVRAKMPPKIVAGTSTRMHFDIHDDAGAKVFDGEVEVLFCG